MRIAATSFADIVSGGHAKVNAGLHSWRGSLGLDMPIDGTPRLQTRRLAGETYGIRRLHGWLYDRRPADYRIPIPQILAPLYSAGPPPHRAMHFPFERCALSRAGGAGQLAEKLRQGSEGCATGFARGYDCTGQSIIIGHVHASVRPADQTQ